MKSLVCCFLLFAASGVALATPTEIKLTGSYPIHFQSVGLDLSCFSNVRAFFTGGPGSGPATPGGFSMSACSYNAGANIVSNPYPSSYPTYPVQGIYGLRFSMEDSIGTIKGFGLDGTSLDTAHFAFQPYTVAGLTIDAQGNYYTDPNATSGYIVDGSPSPMYIGLGTVTNTNLVTVNGFAQFAPEPAAWVLGVLGLTLLAALGWFKPASRRIS